MSLRPHLQVFPTIIQPTLLLGLPAHMGLEQIEIAEQMIILSLFLETSEAACPLCQQIAHRVHSHYVRTLQNLPCVGKTLRLLVQVRRFFCENPECIRKMFAERIPDLTSVYARRTTRATSTLSKIGFALRGKAGAAMSAFLGLPSKSHDHPENAPSSARSSCTNSSDAWSR